MPSLCYPALRAKTLTQEWISIFCQDHLDPGTREVRIHHNCSPAKQPKCPIRNSLPSAFWPVNTQLLYTGENIITCLKNCVQIHPFPSLYPLLMGWPRSPEENYTGLAFFELTKCTFQTTMFSVQNVYCLPIFLLLILATSSQKIQWCC